MHHISAKLRSRTDWTVMVMKEEDAARPSYILLNAPQHPLSDLKRGGFDLTSTRYHYLIAHRNVLAAQLKFGLVLLQGGELIALIRRDAFDPHTGELRADVRAELEGIDSYAEVGQTGDDVTVLVEGTIAPVDIQTLGPWTLLTGDAVILPTGRRLEGFPEEPQPRAAELATWWRELTQGAPAPATDPPASEPPLEKVDPAQGRRDSRESMVAATVGLVFEMGGRLIVDEQKVPHLLIPVGDHVECHRLPGLAVEKLLRRIAYRRLKQTLNQQAVKDAVALLCTLAEEEGEESIVGIRVIHRAGVTYLDLGDAQRTIIEVGASGWRPIDEAECPVYFFRPNSLAALPHPVRGSSLLDLQKVLNISHRDLVLIAGWLVGALSGIQPYPLLVVNGEPGAGKSYGTRAIRDLVDPRTIDLRSLPRKEQDLLIAVQNQHVLACDNVSAISPELSDALCRLATGGSFGTRTLFFTAEETVLTACKPVVLNGVPELLSQSDLADRAMLITLQRITEEERLPERQVKAVYALLQPGILGALLDALAAGLKDRDQIQLDRLPRMADFAQLVVAAEQACPWPAGTFMAAYTEVQVAAAGSLLDGNEFASTLLAMVEEMGHWTGNYKALLSDLGRRRLAAGGHGLPRGWPATAKAAATAVRRAGPALRQLGIEIDFRDRNAAGAIVTFALVTRPQPLTPAPQPAAAPQDAVAAGSARRGPVMGEA